MGLWVSLLTSNAQMLGAFWEASNFGGTQFNHEEQTMATWPHGRDDAIGYIGFQTKSPTASFYEHHRQPLTGGYTTYKNGDDWGMVYVYGIILPSGKQT